MKIWICPECDHEFNPQEQNPHWCGSTVDIRCPDCGTPLNVAFEKDWIKK